MAERSSDTGGKRVGGVESRLEAIGRTGDRFHPRRSSRPQVTRGERFALKTVVRVRSGFPAATRLSTAGQVGPVPRGKTLTSARREHADGARRSLRLSASTIGRLSLLIESGLAAAFPIRVFPPAGAMREDQEDRAAARTRKHQRVDRAARPESASGDALQAARGAGRANAGRDDRIRGQAITGPPGPGG
jgi:hypothetical protein